MLLEAPFTEEKIRALKVGDMVEITGVVFTGRDAVHKYLHDGGALAGRPDRRHHLPLRPGGRAGGRALGGQGGRPDHLHPRGAVPGRPDPQVPAARRHRQGRHGREDARRLPRVGCVYLHAVGGAAQVLADTVTAVEGVHLMEKFGSPEAIWVFRVLAVPRRGDDGRARQFAACQSAGGVGGGSAAHPAGRLKA